MRFCDVFFVGGLQIDAEGSTNLIGLRGKDGRMRLRGPGSIGTTSIGSLAPDVIVFSREHSRRRFVERVDYVSVPGWKRRAAAGLSGGPRLVITPLATLDFDRGHMRLRSTHPGVLVDEVVASTGFELLIPARVPTTEPVRAGELEALANLGLSVATEGSPASADATASSRGPRATPAGAAQREGR